jgi:hypothetical protein
MEVRTCKWCGQELTPKETQNKKRMCSYCSAKSPLLPYFVKARDDLREALGLPRMG